MTTDQTRLPRSIGLTGGVSFIVGTIIGAGIFVSARGVAYYSGSVGLTLVTWTICGLVSLLGAFCYAELGTVVKLSGADYSYLHEAYGPLVSFQFSWITNLLIKPGSQATLALTTGSYLATPLYGANCSNVPGLLTKSLAVLVLLTLGIVNAMSVRLASRIQILSTFMKLFAVAAIVAGGVVMLALGHTQNLATGFEGTETRVGMVMTAFYSSMWAFDGWNTANYITEEIINVERNLPLSILIAVPTVVVIYLLINISYFSVLSLQDVVQSQTTALTWADKVVPSFSWAIPVFVALSCFGSCNGSLFSGGRLISVAAQNNHLPSILCMVHVTRFTPISAIIANVTLAIIFIFLASISELINLMGFVQWIFYSLVFLSLIIFRYRKPYSEQERLIRVPIIIPVICFFFSLCLVLIPLLTSPQKGYFFTLAFILLGYVVYLPLVHLRLKPPFMNGVTLALQKLLGLVVPDRKCD